MTPEHKNPHEGWGHTIDRSDPVNYCPACEVHYWHTHANLCDHCGDSATMHFLSRGYTEELAKLEWWQHHTDYCDACHETSSRLR